MIVNPMPLHAAAKPRSETVETSKLLGMALLGCRRHVGASPKLHNLPAPLLHRSVREPVHNSRDAPGCGEWS